MSTKPAIERDNVATEDHRERLADLPPSAKLAAKVLEVEGPLPLAGVADETMLPDRTARYALNRLKDEDLVSVGYDPTDARRRVYALQAPSGE